MATQTFYISSIGQKTYTSEQSGYPMNNVIGASTSSTTYGGFTARTGRSATTYVNLIFDASELPENVIINSATIKIKASVSSTSYLTTRTVRPWVQDDYAATARTISATATVYEFDVSSYVNSRENLFDSSGEPDVGFQFYVGRGTSNYSTAAYGRLYGAELIIDYTPSVTHHLTIDNKGNYNVTPESGEYGEGTNVLITIAEDNLPTVTLDGTNITDQFTSRVLSNSFSGTPTASSNTGISSGSSYIGQAVGQTAENPSTSTSNWYGSSSASVDTEYAQYTFDLSSIPSNATDIQVSCKVAGKAENSTYNHTSGGRYSEWGLLSNGTKKGSQIHATSTSISVYEFTDTGTWSRSELNNLQLRHYVGYYGGSTNGVTLTITYSLPRGNSVYEYNLSIGTTDHILIIGSVDQDKLHIKQNGSWVIVNKVYKKTNNTWTEITDLLDLFKDLVHGLYMDYMRNDVVDFYKDYDLIADWDMSTFTNNQVSTLVDGVTHTWQASGLVTLQEDGSLLVEGSSNGANYLKLTTLNNILLGTDWFIEVLARPLELVTTSASSVIYDLGSIAATGNNSIAFCNAIKRKSSDYLLSNSKLYNNNAYVLNDIYTDIKYNDYNLIRTGIYPISNNQSKMFCYINDIYQSSQPFLTRSVPDNVAWLSNNIYIGRSAIGSYNNILGIGIRIKYLRIYRKKNG